MTPDLRIYQLATLYPRRPEHSPWTAYTTDIYDASGRAVVRTDGHPIDVVGGDANLALHALAPTAILPGAWPT